MKVYDYATDLPIREATPYDISEYDGYLFSPGVSIDTYTMPAFLLPDIEDSVLSVYVM